MRCVICKHGITRPGQVTVTLERQSATVVVRRVPAEVCTNCGEEYVDEATAASLLATAETAVRQGVEVDVRGYTPA